MGSPVTGPVTLADMERLLRPLQLELKEIHVKLDKIAVIEQNVEAIQEDVQGLKESVKTSCKDINNIWDHLRSTAEKLDYQEGQDRRMNVVIHGIQEANGETWEEAKRKVIEKCEEAGVRLDDRAIQRAHRIFGKEHPRPIVAKFAYYGDRDRVLGIGRKLSGLRFSPDITVLQRKRRQFLRPIQEEAFKRKRKTYFTQDKLIVDNLVFQTDALLTGNVTVRLPDGRVYPVKSLEDAFDFIEGDYGRTSNAAGKRQRSPRVEDSGGNKRGLYAYGAEHNALFGTQSQEVNVRLSGVPEDGPI